jgi:hypothetical protein
MKQEYTVFAGSMETLDHTISRSLLEILARAPRFGLGRDPTKQNHVFQTLILRAFVVEKVTHGKQNTFWRSIELKDAVMNGEFDSVIKSVNDLTIHTDSSVAKVENTMKRLFRSITKNTRKMRECAGKASY